MERKPDGSVDSFRSSRNRPRWQYATFIVALCHDLGKPPTTEFFEGRTRSYGHDEAGIEPTISFLNRLGIYTVDGFDVRDPANTVRPENLFLLRHGG